jgi:hypothetical protein
MAAVAERMEIVHRDIINVPVILVMDFQWPVGSAAALALPAEFLETLLAKIVPMRCLKVLLVFFFSHSPTPNSPSLLRPASADESRAPD